MSNATKQEQVFAEVVRRFAGDIMSSEASRLKANVARAKRAARNSASLDSCVCGERGEPCDGYDPATDGLT